MSDPFFMSFMRYMYRFIIHLFCNCNKVLRKISVLQVVLLQLLQSKLLLVDQGFWNT